MLMRLMSKGEYLIVPKGTKFTGSGKLGLRVSPSRGRYCQLYKWSLGCCLLCRYDRFTLKSDGSAIQKSCPTRVTGNWFIDKYIVVLFHWFILFSFFLQLLYLKLVSVLFPTSDFRHSVTTPSMLFLGQILAICPVRSLRDVAVGLFVCNLFTQVSILF